MHLRAALCHFSSCPGLFSMHKWPLSPALLDMPNCRFRLMAAIMILIELAIQMPAWNSKSAQKYQMVFKIIFNKEVVMKMFLLILQPTHTWQFHTSYVLFAVHYDGCYCYSNWLPSGGIILWLE